MTKAAFEKIAEGLTEILLSSIPDGLLDGLPAEDQAAIVAAIGKPVRLVGYDEWGRAELEFWDADGDLHTIWMPPRQSEVAALLTERQT